MIERSYWTIRLAIALRTVMHERYMSLHVVWRPWWQWRGPRWWLEDSNGHRYEGWPW